MTINILSDEIQNKEIIREVLSKEIVFEKLFNFHSRGLNPSSLDDISF